MYYSKKWIIISETYTASDFFIEFNRMDANAILCYINHFVFVNPEIKKLPEADYILLLDFFRDVNLLLAVTRKRNKESVHDYFVPDKYDVYSFYSNYNNNSVNRIIWEITKLIFSSPDAEELQYKEVRMLINFMHSLNYCIIDLRKEYGIDVEKKAG